MSDFDRNYASATRGVGAGRAVAIDAGLRAYMIRVYNYMAMGVGITGVAAWLTYQAAVVTNASGAITGLTPFGSAIFGGPAVIVLMLGTLGLVMFISFRIQHLQPATALTLFLVYAALLGLMLSSVFLAYTHTSITRVFFISAASFGGLVVRLHDPAQPVGLRVVPGDGVDRIAHRHGGQYLSQSARWHLYFRRRRPDLRGPDRVGYPNDQGNVRCAGRRHHGGPQGHHGR